MENNWSELKLTRIKVKSEAKIELHNFLIIFLDFE